MPEFKKISNPGKYKPHFPSIIRARYGLDNGKKISIVPDDPDILTMTIQYLYTNYREDLVVPIDDKFDVFIESKLGYSITSITVVFYSENEDEPTAVIKNFELDANTNNVDLKDVLGLEELIASQNMTIYAYSSVNRYGLHVNTAVGTTVTLKYNDITKTILENTTEVVPMEFNTTADITVSNIIGYNVNIDINGNISEELHQTVLVDRETYIQTNSTPKEYSINIIDDPLNFLDFTTTTTDQVTAKYHTNVTVKSKEIYGYRLVGIHVGNSDLITELPYTFIVEGNTNITPVYEVEEYTVTIESTNYCTLYVLHNDNIYTDDTDTGIPDSFTVKYGDTINISLRNFDNLNTYYKGLLINGEEIEPTNSLVVTKDISIKAVLGQIAPLNTYGIYFDNTIDLTRRIMVNYSGKNYTSSLPEKIPENSRISIYVDPSTGYNLDYVTINGVKVAYKNAGTPVGYKPNVNGWIIEHILQDDIEIKAYSKIKTFQITLIAPNTNAKLAKNGVEQSQTIFEANYGDKITFLNVTPKEGYYLEKIYVQEENNNIIDLTKDSFMNVTQNLVFVINSIEFSKLSTMKDFAVNNIEGYENITEVPIEFSPTIVDTKDAEDWTNAFSGCISLIHAPDPFYDMTNAKVCDYMFSNKYADGDEEQEIAAACYWLTSASEVPFGPNVLSMVGTFANCISLKSPGEFPANVTDITGCYESTLIDISYPIPSKVTTMEQTFSYCKLLTLICDELPSTLVNLNETFIDCISFVGQKIDDSNPSRDIHIPANVTDMSFTFVNCYSLSDIHIYIESENVTDATDCLAVTEYLDDIMVTMDNDSAMTVIEALYEKEKISSIQTAYDQLMNKQAEYLANLKLEKYRDNPQLAIADTSPAQELHNVYVGTRYVHVKAGSTTYETFFTAMSNALYNANWNTYLRDDM